jgi:hypothetical protein
VIGHLNGWGQIPGVDSHRLVHPDGAKVGMILYRERTRPLLRLSALVDRWSHHPSFTSHKNGLPDVVATAEGEYAVTLTISGVVDGKPAQQDLGFVFGDDFYALIQGICFVEAEFARMASVVRHLVVNDQHVLGVRRRRFLYTPPRRWQGLARGFQTDWYPPNYPSNPSSLSVFPATPTELSAADLVESRLRVDMSRGFKVDAVTGPTDLASSFGLAGVGYGVTGVTANQRAFLRRFVVFRDARHAYPLLLETAAPESARPALERIFEEVCASVQPLPQPAAGDKSSTALAHWLG